MKFSYSLTCGIASKQLSKIARRLITYISDLKKSANDPSYATDECSLFLPFDKKRILESARAARRFATQQLKYIFVIGIGGSNLGTKAVYDALYGAYDLWNPERYPKMIFLDTLDAEILESFGVFARRVSRNPKEFCIVVISKSGTTTETAVNLEHFISRLHLGVRVCAERLMVITDYESALWRAAKEKNIATLAIPARVGGRYSVLSAVGLFPLALAGIDIGELCEGARRQTAACMRFDSAQNPALASASAIYAHAQNGVRVHDLFLFHPECESLGKWYRQLMGESIGKEKNRSGTLVHSGIIPTVSVGSTDLHSVGQLYFSVPGSILTTFIAPFVYVQRSSSSSSSPRQFFPDLVAGAKGKTPPQVMRAIYEGVCRAYRKKKLPFMEVQFSTVSPHEMGAFFQWKITEIMLLGKLFGINAFDQPNVELYKEETRKILQ